jgi:hypothetical protein
MLDNAEVFRALNERIATLERARLEIVCECAEEGCTERVVITPVEFHEVRRHRGWYVVRPGHQRHERVIESQPSFLVVEKIAA